MNYIGVEGGNAVFLERRGSRGSGYFFIQDQGSLTPIWEIGEENYIRRSGKTKKVEIRVPPEEFSPSQVVYHLRTSHSGNLTVEKYSIQFREDEIKLAKLNAENLADLNFSIIGAEETWVQRFQNRIPNLVQGVQSRQNDLGVEFEFGRDAVRTQEVFSDPNVGTSRLV